MPTRRDFGTKPKAENYSKQAKPLSKLKEI